MPSPPSLSVDRLLASWCRDVSQAQKKKQLGLRSTLFRRAIAPSTFQLYLDNDLQSFISFVTARSYKSSCCHLLHSCLW